MVIRALSFQSTHPMRDATLARMGDDGDGDISIHASHAGCDRNQVPAPYALTYFNPRIPCGMRPVKGGVKIVEMPFQSTHPMRDATSIKVQAVKAGQFQSTHPMRDATSTGRLKRLAILQFQSTHPMRDATSENSIEVVNDVISIHASHAGCDDRRIRHDQQ